MRKLFTVILCSIFSYSQAQDIAWQKTKTIGFSETTVDLAVDGDDNVYVLGHYNGTDDLDQILIKYNDSGTEQWFRTFDSGNRDAPVAVGVDASDNIYTVANTGPEAQNTAVLRKYNSSGTLQWSQSIGGAAGNVIVKMIVDDSGNCYLGGSANLNQAYLTKYNSSGSFQWSSNYNGPATGEDRYNDFIINGGEITAVGYEITASGEAYLMVNIDIDNGSDDGNELSSINGQAIAINNYDDGFNDYAIVGEDAGGTIRLINASKFGSLSTNLTTSMTGDVTDILHHVSSNYILVSTTTDLYAFSRPNNLTAYDTDWSASLGDASQSVLRLNSQGNFLVGFGAGLGTSDLFVRTYDYKGNLLDEKSATAFDALNSKGMVLNSADDPIQIGHLTQLYTVQYCSEIDISFDVSNAALYVPSLHEVRICEDNPQLTTTLSATPASFSWSPTTGLSDPNSLNPEITATGTYVLTVTSSSGCTSANSIHVVNSAQAPPKSIRLNGLLIPNADSDNRFAILPEGSTTTLGGAQSNTIYEWYMVEDPTFVELSEGSSSITISEAGTYYAIVTDSDCAVTSYFATLLFYSPTGSDYYWVGGTGDWSDTDNWATTSGGSTKHTQVPLRTDNVIFDQNSFSQTDQVVSLDMDGEFHNLTISNLSHTASIESTSGGDELQVYGSMILDNQLTLTDTDITFLSDQSETITTNGVELDFISISGSGSWTLQDELQGRTMTLLSGGIDLNNQRLDLSSNLNLNLDNTTINFGGAEINANTLDVNGSNLTLNLNSATFNINTNWLTDDGAGLTINPGTSTINLSGSGNFRTNGDSYATVNIAIEANRSLTIEGNNSFENLIIQPTDNTTNGSIRLTSGHTQSVDNLSLIGYKLGTNGLGTRELTLESTGAGSQAFIVSTSGSTVNAKRVALQDIAASGATFNAIESTNNGNNSGWNFINDTEAPAFDLGFPSIFNIGTWSSDLLQFDFNYKMDENAVIYMIILEDGADLPSVQQIVDGDDASDDPAPYSATFTYVETPEVVSKTTSTTLPGSSGVQYDVYVVAEDMASSPNQQSASIKIDIATADLEAPTFSLDGLSQNTPSSLLFEYQIDEEGEIFYVLLNNTQSAPDISQIRSGTDGDNLPSVTFGSIVIGSPDVDVQKNTVLPSLQAESTYSIYYFAEDTETPPNVSSSAKTASATTGSKITNSITFVLSGTYTFGDDPFTLSATAASGDPVEFESSDPDVVSISGTTATIVGGGTVTITATEDGNEDYLAANPVDQTITIDPLSQTITFNALTPRTFGDPDFDLTATASSSLTVDYSSDNTAVATVLGSTVTIVGAGTATITATQNGNDDYNAATPIDQDLVVNPANQTISFDLLMDRSFDDAPFNLTATASSELDVSFGSSNTSVAMVSGNTVTITGVGTTNITASQDGNTNYNAATPVVRSLTVNPADQTITFGPLSNKTIEDDPFTLGATATSSLMVTYASSNLDVATVSGNTVTIIGTGTTDITASQAGNMNYNAAPDVTQTLTVVGATQTITFNPLPGKTFGDESFVLGATASSGLTVSYTSSNTDVAAVSGSTVTITGAGMATITALQAGNDDYGPADPIEQVLSVMKANQTISFDPLAVKTFGDADFDLEATATSGLTVSYESDDLSVAMIDGSSVSIIGAGTANITASQIGDDNYEEATEVVQTLTVNPADQMISFSLGANANKVFGEDPFDLIGTSTSGLTINYSSTNQEVAMVDEGRIEIIGAGITTITASQPGNDDYNAANPVEAVLNVTKANPIISFNPTTIGDQLLSDGSVTLDIQIDTGSPLTVEITNGSAEITEIGPEFYEVTYDDLGEVTIRATSSETSNYNTISEEISFNVVSVLKADQSITFDQIGTKTYGDAPFELEATTTSGLSLTYTIVSGPATLDGSEVTITGAGTIVIKASQSGNDDFNPAEDVELTFEIAKADQTITIGAIADKLTTDANFEISASVDSGLELTYSLEGPANLNGNLLSLTGEAGTVTITVSQAGNDNYNAAQVSESFDVNQPADNQVVTSIDGSIETNIIFYPNPAHEYFKITGLEIDIDTTIDLLDLGGGIIKQSVNVNSEGTISLEGISAGTYLIRLLKGNKSITTRLIVQ